MSVEEKLYHGLFWIVTCITALNLILDVIIICWYKGFCCNWPKIRPTTLKKYICRLSLVNCIISVKVLSQSFQFVINVYYIATYPQGLCYTFGILDQFLWLLSTGISVVIAEGLRSKATKCIPVNYEFEKYQAGLCFAIFVFAIIVTLIPVFPILFKKHHKIYGWADGGTDEYHLDNFQCWISDDYGLWALMFYAPLSLYWMYCIGVLVYTCCKWGKYESKQQKEFRPMIWYTCVFVVQWAPRAVLRWFIAFEEDSTAPVWMVYLFWIGYSIQGIGNFVIWTCYIKDDYQGLSGTDTETESDVNQTMELTGNNNNNL